VSDVLADHVESADVLVLAISDCEIDEDELAMMEAMLRVCSSRRQQSSKS
jgi:hypothetical protein